MSDSFSRLNPCLTNLKLIPPQQFHWFFPRTFELSSWPGSPLRNWHLHARLHAIFFAGASQSVCPNSQPNVQSRGYYCLQALPWLQTASNEAMGLHQNYTDVFCTEKGNYSSFYTTKLNGVSKTSKSAFRVKPPLHISCVNWPGSTANMVANDDP